MVGATRNGRDAEARGPERAKGTPGDSEEGGGEQGGRQRKLDAVCRLLCRKGG